MAGWFTYFYGNIRAQGAQGGKGYWAGGQNNLAAFQSEIDGIDFSTDAAINPSAALATARYGVAGVNSSTAGYFGGGVGGPFGGAYTNEIDGIDFSTETGINPSVTLSFARDVTGGGINSASRGFFCGGRTGAVASYSNKIDGIDFGTETSINPAATLSVARYSVAAVNSADCGYIAGGINPSSNEIDGFQFNTDTSINPAATLSSSRGNAAGFNSASRGYFAGGFSGYDPTSVIDGIQFSNEAGFTLSAALTVARDRGAGVNSTTRGYAGSGRGLSGSYLTSIDGINFDTETAFSTSATLTNTRFLLGSAQSGSL